MQEQVHKETNTLPEKFLEQRPVGKQISTFLKLYKNFTYFIGEHLTARPGLPRKR